jgi:sulfite exporter TauE/SafE
MSESLLAGLLLGLFGSGHCLGMCGGIAAALGGAARRWPLALAYHVGRIGSYAVLGALFGLLVAIGADALRPLLPLIGALLRSLAALLVIAMGLYVAGWWPGLTRLEAVGARLWRHVAPLTRRLLPPSNLGAALLLGALWGLLPCGLIYSSLAWAGASGDAGDAALRMAAFGLGTLPAMATVTLGGQQLQRKLQKPLLRKIAGTALIGMGLFALAQPWLHGHAAHDAHSVDHSMHEHHHDHD